MTQKVLRAFIRLVLESKRDHDDDSDNVVKSRNLLLEPEHNTHRYESSSGEGSVSGEVITEPDSLSISDDSSIDTGDGYEDVSAYKKDNEKKDVIKREASGAAAIGGGPAMPLGVGPHYPAPDSPAVKRVKRQIDVVGRAYGGAKPTKKRKK